MPYYATNRMLHTFDDAAVDTLVDLCGPNGPVPCVVEVRHLGGALQRTPSPGNAVGHCGARYVVGFNSPFSGHEPDVDELERVRADHDRVLRRMQPWSTGGQCLNFLSGHSATSANVRAAFHAEDQLAELKQRTIRTTFSRSTPHPASGIESSKPLRPGRPRRRKSTDGRLSGQD